MKALILVAHGSRQKEANDDFQTLVAAVAARVGHGFDLVRHGFLEMAEPELSAVIREVVEQGALSVKIVPYFLGPGSHVSRDIPALVTAAEEVHPQVRFVVTSHLGASEEMLEALAALAAH